MAAESLHMNWRSFLLLIACIASARAEIVLQQGTNLSADVSTVDARLAIDLLGSIWIVPADGGQAKILSDNLLPAKRPRWSPDGNRILYQTLNAGKGQIWTIDLDGNISKKISRGIYFDHQPDWHPDGERVVFSSARGTTGFDLWEIDLPTGLLWRLSSHPGDESEPVWSADGRQLAYIRRFDSQWSLMLRRHGQPDEEIVVSNEPLSAPSWRPDGSLLTFLRRTGSELSVEMAILSDPPLIKTLVSGEDFFVSPVSWLDKKRLFYTSDGVIKTRDFDDWNSRPVAFYAAVGQPDSRSTRRPEPTELPLIDPPGVKLVIRAARLFDGKGCDYRRGLDVLIDGPRIAALVSRREWPDATVLNLGDVTVLPGFIDSYSALSSKDQKIHGAELLAYGVTTLVTNDHRPGYDPLIWEHEETPGPRLLWAGDIVNSRPDDGKRYRLVTIPSSGLTDSDRRSAVSRWQSKGIPVLAESWRIGLGVGADLLLGVDALPTSPGGNRYQDVQLATMAGPIALVSGLADAGTPGLADLFRSRQAQLLQHRRPVLRRFSWIPDFSRSESVIMLGSKPSGLPPGLALHAEMQALAAAGLRGDQVFRAAGQNPAAVLGLENQIGRITEGAFADMVLVSGDPLVRVSDAMNIVAVVRSGRFYSLVSLLERAGAPPAVE
ncbi:MAG: amidohydrolase family protein [Woeseia sp.]